MRRRRGSLAAKASLPAARRLLRPLAPSGRRTPPRGLLPHPAPRPRPRGGLRRLGPPGAGGGTALKGHSTEARESLSAVRPAGLGGGARVEVGRLGPRGVGVFSPRSRPPRRRPRAGPRGAIPCGPRPPTRRLSSRGSALRPTPYASWTVKNL